MKKTLLFVCSLLMSVGMNAADFETATEAVKSMGVGWNLGNALEANKQNIDDVKITDPSNDNFWGRQGLESENCWGQATTKPELIKMMKEAGFGAIRVPITWYNHMDKDGNVSKEWMKRVHEVVDYVIDQGLYCIINVHHDTGAESDEFNSWIKADEDNYNSNKSRYENLWKQIATEFKDYDQKLLFESYNEMLDKISSWCFASFKATGQYDEAIATSAYKGINAYAQSFVTTVRATGGNNASRNLIVNTYGACCGSGTWNTHLKDPLSQLTIPTDNVEGHIAVEVHDYPNIENGISGAKSEFDDMIKAWDTNILSKGIPMILGEWGTSNVDKGEGKTDYDLRKDVMFEFVDYVIQQCKTNGVATFYWMGLSDGVYRGIPAFNQPDLAERIIKAYYGNTSGYKYPTIDGMDDLTLWEGSTQLEWTSYISIEGSIFSNRDYKHYLQLTYQQNFAGLGEGEEYDDIQLQYGDWSAKPVFKVGDTNCDGDIVPSTIYGTGSGTEHITPISFGMSAYSTICNKGLIVFGHGVLLKKIELVKNPNTSGITQTISIDEIEHPFYNLQGQRISNPRKGIYIRNGKKYIQR